VQLDHPRRARTQDVVEIHQLLFIPKKETYFDVKSSKTSG